MESGCRASVLTALLSWEREELWIEFGQTWESCASWECRLANQSQGSEFLLGSVGAGP